MARADPCCLLQLADRLVNQIVVVAARLEILYQQRDVDVGVALAVRPVAEVLVTQTLTKQLDDTILCCSLGVCLINGVSGVFG